jgi:hypothetical protein
MTPVVSDSINTGSLVLQRDSESESFTTVLYIRYPFLVCQLYPPVTSVSVVPVVTVS